MVSLVTLAVLLATLVTTPVMVGETRRCFLSCYLELFGLLWADAVLHTAVAMAGGLERASGTQRGRLDPTWRRRRHQHSGRGSSWCCIEREGGSCRW